MFINCVEKRFYKNFVKCETKIKRYKGENYDGMHMRATVPLQSWKNCSTIPRRIIAILHIKLYSKEAMAFDN